VKRIAQIYSNTGQFQREEIGDRTKRRMRVTVQLRRSLETVIFAGTKRKRPVPQDEAQSCR
jgi:hypothetical protein